MNGQPYTPYLDQPLTEAEQAERTRLRRKARLEEKLYLLAKRLGRFHRAHYSRWAALNALLPRCYRAAWRLPLAHTPRLRPPVPIQPGRLCRTSAEYSHLEELDNRHDRPAAMARLDHNPTYANGWIASYERLKKNETRPDLLPLLAAEALKKFEAELPEREAYLQGFREEDPPAYLRHLDSLRKNAAAFCQHVEADLGRVGVPVVVDGLEQHGPGPAGRTADGQDGVNRAGVAPIEFETYIKSEHSAALLSFLKEQYTNSKPKIITCMLFALHDLGALTIHPTHDNKTEMHKALIRFFGNVGTRQAFNTSLSIFDRASEKQQKEIQDHRKKINDYMKPYLDKV